MPSLLITLGAPNDSQGALSSIARGRAESALREYRQRPRKIVVTGGFGQHFNTTGRPHAYYVARFLVAEGVAPEDLMQVSNSSNTVDDARLSMTFVERSETRALCIITSDFHSERAGLIFRALYPNHVVEVVGDPVVLPAEERRRLCEHEAAAVQRLHAQGGIVVRAMGEFWPLRGP